MLYEPQELKQDCDGWELYKKTKFNYQPVRRYITLVQEDYTKNKVWVCAYLSNLYNTFQVGTLYRRSTMHKTQMALNNYFDYEKWLLKYDPQSQEQDQTTNQSPDKKLPANMKRQLSQLPEQQTQQRCQNNVLSKSLSTSHIPS